jgi:transcriptional regulator with GAF, ATPase, and Fis domain
MNASARTGSPSATEDRVELETLLADVAARLMGATAADVPRAVEDALERIRAFFDADRRGAAEAAVRRGEEGLTERKLRDALAEVQRLREQLEHENVYLRKEAKIGLGPERLIGRGEAMRRTLRLAEQVAVTDSTVLLVGETGTGKERFASYIHERSRRGDRAMVRVNCSAIPAALIESELFGREKGAYTGALSRQVGRFELASGSTIFLDEIGELPLDMQVKLLRVVEQRTLERLGSPRAVPVDVRIIAATNRDLGAAVHEGRFRQDLYYRLDVFPITVPPLRERVDDIPLLVEAFVEEFARSTGKHVDDVDPASLAAMLAHHWPGNVRELRNVIERAMIMANGTTLHVDLPSAVAPVPAAATSAPASERDRLRDVLQATGWRIRGPHGAAARLGLKPTTLESRLKKLGLDRPGT